MTNSSNQILHHQDVYQIRPLLPYDWRKRIATKHPDITTRQITESFYLRTKNAVYAEKVFTIIATMLINVDKPELAAKCLNRIDFCKSVQLVVPTI